MEDDAAVIYAYMEERGGAMPFWDKSYPEDIKERFNMSKAAFKRALGKLMKEEKVYQEEGWTYFRNKGNKSTTLYFTYKVVLFNAHVQE